MEQWFTNLSPLASNIIILAIVYVIKAIMSKISPHEPLQVFAFFCRQLGNKVNKHDNSNQQQILSGSASILVTLVPLLIILWLFEDFILVPELWQATLLYLALGAFNVKAASFKLAQALVNKLSYQAKQHAKSMLLRETENLSPLGLTKANIEAQILHFLQQQFVVIMLFLSTDALTALAYRLLLVMHQSWNIKQVKFNQFGLPARTCLNLITWLPSRLLGLMMLFTSIGQDFLLKWRLTKHHFFKLDNSFVIHIFALNVGTVLGGVAMYEGVKLRRPSFNERAKPSEPTDIIHASKQILTLEIFSFIIILFLLLFSVVSL